MHLVCDQPAGQCTPADMRLAVLHIIDAAQGVLIWMDVHGNERDEQSADETPAC